MILKFLYILKLKTICSKYFFRSMNIFLQFTLYFSIICLTHKIKKVSTIFLFDRQTYFSTAHDTMNRFSKVDYHLIHFHFAHFYDSYYMYFQTDCLDHDDSSTVDDKPTTTEQKLMAFPPNSSPVSIAANVPPLTDAPLSPKSPSVLNKRGSLTTVLNIPILPHLPKYSIIIKKSTSDFLGKHFRNNQKRIIIAYLIKSETEQI